MAVMDGDAEEEERMCVEQDMLRFTAKLTAK